MAKTSEARLKASNKYRAKMDIVQFRMKKGIKERIQAKAKSNGESVAAYLTRLVLEDAERANTELVNDNKD